MCITCIQRVGKIQGLSNKEKRFVNSACHPKRGKFTSYCKVIYKCTSRVCFHRGEHASLELQGQQGPLASQREPQRLISWNPTHEQKDLLPLDGVDQERCLFCSNFFSCEWFYSFLSIHPQTAFKTCSFIFFFF